MNDLVPFRSEPKAETDVHIYLLNKLEQFSVPLAEQIKLSLVECSGLHGSVGGLSARLSYWFIGSRKPLN